MTSNCCLTTRYPKDSIWTIKRRPIAAASYTDPECIAPHLYRVWQAIHGAGSYALIIEMAPVVGIEALLEHDLVIEPAAAHEAVIAYPKVDPYQVRFTVNRMGLLARARFMEAPSGD